MTVRNRLVLGTSVLFAARLLLSLIRTGPVLVADEIGYLDNARALAGGVAGQLEIAPFYRGGYSLLLAPIVGLGGSPSFTYHVILALNALLAASVLPLLYLLLARFRGVEPRLAFWAALVGSAYPALTVLSQVAMSENALFPLVCLWLIAFAGLLSGTGGRRGELLWGIGLAAVTGCLWAVHNRMIVAVAITVVGLAWLTARRRLRSSTLLAALVVLGLFVFGTHLLDDFVTNHNYGGSAPDELSERGEALGGLDAWGTALGDLLGQAWYLIVATFGLAAATAAEVVRRVWRKEGEGVLPASILGSLLSLTVGLLVISAFAFSEWTRPDMLIYGRYVEVVAPALVAGGFVVLVRAGAPWSRLVWPVAFVVLTAGVVAVRLSMGDLEAANRWNISALPFVTVQLGGPILIGAAVVAAAGAAALVAVSRRARRLLAPLAVALFGIVSLYGIVNPVRRSQRAVYPAGWTSPQGAAEAAGARSVAYDLAHYDAIGLYTLQWFLPNTKMSLFHGNRQPPSSRFVISGEGWAREHPRSHAVPLWSDVGRDQTLWRLRGPASR